MGKADYIASGYGYRTDDQGRIVQAYGELRLTDDPQRDGKAQREAGGAARQPGDDGGHYIGTRFGGSPGAENLSAQNQVVNRSDYKRLENSWARDLQQGNRVFVSIESSYPGSQDRPAVLSGTYTVVRPDGATFTDHFSFTNENMHTGDLAKDVGGLDNAPVSQLPPGVTQADLEADLKYDQGRVFQKNDPNALNVTMAEEFQELAQSRAEAQFKSSVSAQAVTGGQGQAGAPGQAASSFSSGVSALSAQTETGGQGQAGAPGQAASSFSSGVSTLSAGEDTAQSSAPSGSFSAGVEALSGQEAGAAPSAEGEGQGGGQDPGGGPSGGQDIEP